MDKQQRNLADRKQHLTTFYCAMQLDPFCSTRSEVAVLDCTLLSYCQLSLTTNCCEFPFLLGLNGATHHGIQTMLYRGKGFHLQRAAKVH